MLPWRAHARREELMRAARARPKNMCALARAQQKSARITPLLDCTNFSCSTQTFKLVERGKKGGSNTIVKIYDFMILPVLPVDPSEEVM